MLSANDREMKVMRNQEGFYIIKQVYGKYSDTPSKNWDFSQKAIDSSF